VMQVVKIRKKTNNYSYTKINIYKPKVRKENLKQNGRKNS